MKHQYIYELLAQLAVKHKEFLYYKSTLPINQSTKIQKILPIEISQLIKSNTFNLKMNNLFNSLKAKVKVKDTKNLNKEQISLQNIQSSYSIDKYSTIVMSYNIELISLLSKLKTLGILSYNIHSHTVVIHLNILSYSKIVVHSKPSRRIYKSYESVWTNNLGYGISILRTSQGFLTSQEAQEKRIGGELLFTFAP